MGKQWVVPLFVLFSVILMLHCVMLVCVYSSVIELQWILLQIVFLLYEYVNVMLICVHSSWAVIVTGVWKEVEQNLQPGVRSPQTASNASILSIFQLNIPIRYSIFQISIFNKSIFNFQERMHNVHIFKTFNKVSAPPKQPPTPQYFNWIFNTFN